MVKMKITVIKMNQRGLKSAVIQEFCKCEVRDVFPKTMGIFLMENEPILKICLKRVDNVVAKKWKL